MCQSSNVASLAAVVNQYLSMAEKRTDAARQVTNQNTIEDS